MNIVKQLITEDRKFNEEVYSVIVRNNKKYLKYIYDGLTDEEPLIREGCVEALGDIGGYESLPILIKNSADPDKHVRWDIMTSINMILGVFPLNVIVILTGISGPKQRFKFKKCLEELFDKLFPNNSKSVFNDGYYLIKIGKVDEGIDLVLAGLGNQNNDPLEIKKLIATMLRNKGWSEEADEIIRGVD